MEQIVFEGETDSLTFGGGTDSLTTYPAFVKIPTYTEKKIPGKNSEKISLSFTFVHVFVAWYRFDLFVSSHF